jgi:hypothetical protein
MKERYLHLVFSLAMILLLAIAGCIAPPTENSTALGLNNAKGSAANVTGTPVYVSEVTLADYTPPGTTSSGYSEFLTATPIPADITCRIHQKSMFGMNGSAFTFDLKNPPMYINYAVVPKNETVTRVYTDNFDKKTKTLIYSDYSLQSWFEVTVRDNATREIILQDGFGAAKGYPTYLNRTLKIMKNGDLLIEFRGSNIQSSTTVWVKPIGNFEESRLSEFTTCQYWDSYRDTLPTAKQTTLKGVIYTWTVESKVVSKAPTVVKQGTQPIRNESNYQWG